MKSRIRNETRETCVILHETNSLIMIFTRQGSIIRQDRSKLVDSTTLYHGTTRRSDLGVKA
jgi:hypothetical protein